MMRTPASKQRCPIADTRFGRHAAQDRDECRFAAARFRCHAWPLGATAGDAHAPDPRADAAEPSDRPGFAPSRLEGGSVETSA